MQCIRTSKTLLRSPLLRHPRSLAIVQRKHYMLQSSQLPNAMLQPNSAPQIYTLVTAIQQRQEV
jgi:hypothetical protein